MKKIKVGAVSYLNTKPLLYGIEHSTELMQQIELIKDYPSNIAAELQQGSIDIGLAPVTVIPGMREHFIVSDYCIGADGDVASVCLFSEVEMDKIEKILLDYQSRTSSALCRVLLRQYWKKNIPTENTGTDFNDRIRGTTAGVLIGDRALEQRKTSKHIYDLAGTWKKMTGLPFVFAAWIANKSLPHDFLELFNEKNAEGVHNIDAILRTTTSSVYDLHTYYTKNISYKLSPEKLEGMTMFLNLIKEL